MTQLCQLIAVEKGVRNTAERRMTDLFREVQVPALVTGIHRTYEPKDEEGDRLPSESTLVQRSVEKTLADLANAATRLFDVTLTKEAANTAAVADIVVDGETLLADVPVTYMLFLEKQLVNLATFVSKLPIVDPAQRWTYDVDNGFYKAEPVQTMRNKKVPRNWVKAPATDKHPAQVDVYFEDVPVGTWTKVDTSGAIPATRKAELAGRIDKLAQAVKFAREQANGLDVVDRAAGGAVFGYLFA